MRITRTEIEKIMQEEFEVVQAAAPIEAITRAGIQKKNK